MTISEMLENSKDGINLFFEEDLRSKAVNDEAGQKPKGDLSMAQKRSLKEFLKAMFDEAEREEKTPAGPAKDACVTKDAEEDKRKLIDEIGGMLKGKVEEELWRTVMQKAEDLAYKESEAGHDDEVPSDDKKEDVEKVELLKEEEKKKLLDEARKETADIMKAKDEVEEVAGKVGTQDSASEYYKIGCQALGVETKGIMDSALKDAFRVAKALQTKKTAPVVFDEDAASVFKKDMSTLLGALPQRKY